VWKEVEIELVLAFLFVSRKVILANTFDDLLDIGLLEVVAVTLKAVGEVAKVLTADVVGEYHALPFAMLERFGDRVVDVGVP
jgi:hypothetical protein